MEVVFDGINLVALSEITHADSGEEKWSWET
jgi:hypothetical protein